MAEETVHQLVRDHPLTAFLELAVPLAMLDRHRVGPPQPEEVERLRATALLLAEKGDVLLFGGKGAGSTAAKLAEAIAAMAYLPGGVTIFGQHWEAKF